MRIKATLLLLLGLGVTIAVSVGCGTAPASQMIETSSAPETTKVESSAEQPPVPAPEVNVAPAAEEPTSPTPANKAIAAAKDDQDDNAVEVGYKIGMHVPEFGMSLLDGTALTSASLVDEGKPVFIYFHATW